MAVAPVRGVDLHSTDPVLLFETTYVTPSVPVGRSRAEAVTAVELLWRMPPPVLPLAPARPGVLASHGTPARDLAAISRAIEGERTLEAASEKLQHEICRALLANDALVLWIDWPLRMVRSVSGRAAPEVEELVLEVAGSGKRVLVQGAVIEPIGAPPARVVLAMRKPLGVTFARDELAAIGALSIGIAPTFDRLTRSGPRRRAS
ncbi:MAG: hypothetical protein WKG01_17565 [Kofleriaceae bacterium]